MHLFEPLELGDVVLRNRIAVSPMCQYSAFGGLPGPWHMVHLGSRAVGGAALVFTEATAVSPEGRISPGDTGIWDEPQQQAWAPIAAFIAAQGAVPGIQLAHAGRKASTRAPWLGGAPLAEESGAWMPLAPSPVPFDEGHPVPQALDADGLRKVVADFADAATRSRLAGFRVVEIHAGARLPAAPVPVARCPTSATTPMAAASPTARACCWKSWRRCAWPGRRRCR